MTKVNERFEFERDTWGWILYDWKDSTNRKGDPTRTARNSYYGTINQVGYAILDRTAGQCSEIAEILTAIEKATAEICKAARGVNENCD